MTGRLRSEVRSRVAEWLPDPILYRTLALWFAANREQRLLFLDDLVPRGGLAVDVGAWWGPWTYWLSRRSAEVIAFEPNPAAAAFLRRVVGGNVRVEEVGLSDRAAQATLQVSSQRGPDALATLEARHGLPGANRVEVRTVALDDYSLQDLRFIKIDVEGHEAALIAGAERTLQRWQPTVLIEIEQCLNDRPIAELLSRFESMGYGGWLRRSRQWAPLATFDLERDQLAFADRPTSLSYINNFVFMPVGSQPASTRR